MLLAASCDMDGPLLGGTRTRCDKLKQGTQGVKGQKVRSYAACWRSISAESNSVTCSGHMDTCDRLLLLIKQKASSFRLTMAGHT